MKPEHIKWKRKPLKAAARHLLRSQYWAAVGVCFIMMMFFDRYFVSKQAIVSYNPAWETEEPVMQESLHSEPLRFMQELTQDITSHIHEKRETDPSYATRGVLSALLGRVTDPSGAFVKTLYSVDQFVQNEIGAGISFLGVTLLDIVIYLFVTNLVQVGERRFFLESTVDPDTPIRRIFFLYQEKRILRPAWIMFLRQMRLFLWAFTLIMLPIKYYEYAMIPYIVAENPDLKAKEVFRLSRQMMRGNRFRMFCLHLSFWYWDLLSMATLGLAGFFFVNPYRTSTETELYLLLRQEAVQRGYEYADRLLGIDAFLKEPYAKVRQQPEGRFLQYDRKYQLHTYILLFFSFSLIGWLWEVGIHLVEDGEFVNRGVLFGPWLPIYGTGGVAIVFLLRKLGKSPLILFLSSMTLCSVVEYFTSWMLEVTQHAKWWDYSGYLFNLNGRICLEGALVFGMGGCLFVYFGAPLLDDLYKKISLRTQWKICLVLITFFLCDTLYSYFNPNMGKGITDYESRQCRECVKQSAEAENEIFLDSVNGFFTPSRINSEINHSTMKIHGDKEAQV